ncbi:MAG: hypothetical protein EKK45_10815 [Curvibacter sp.]|nr:MAG: hypothetical protein EKK45_10815 [Curvibacter sp.]
MIQILDDKVATLAYQSKTPQYGMPECDENRNASAFYKNASSAENTPILDDYIEVHENIPN